MADLRTRNNVASKKSYEKTLERQYADEYEHEMVRQHILTNPDTEAYHWSVVPEEYLYEAGYITDFNKHRQERLMRKKEKKEGENRVRDYGFDGLARTCSGSNVVYGGLQAKYYIKRQVCACDIGSFLAMQMALTVNNPLSKGFLYTSSGLQADLVGVVANPLYPIRHVLHLWKHPDARSTPILPPIQLECDKPLREEQADALKQLEDKDGINALNTPCRWGKTMVAGHHTKRINANLVVAIAPLLVSVENLQDRLACFLPEYSALLVNSDTGGTTNIEEIKTFLASEGKHILYSTFKSAEDILSELLTDYEDTYILCDEVHNVNEQLCVFIQQFPKGLVMSATLPEEIIYWLDINHTVYISFAQAIKDRIIVDYTLWLPHLTKAADGTTSVDVEIPVEFATYDSDLAAKAFYLAVVMLKTGSRRCISYLGRQEDCDRFMEVVAQIFETYHGLTIWTGKIDSTISKTNRRQVLEAFQTGQDDVYHILTSVRILDEAVDIPRCDSVFITNVGEHSSDIRMMQRSQRSSTKDPKNLSKHNNIILWADGWEKCVGALDLLREADPEFHKKVRIADCNYDKSGDGVRVKEIDAQRLEFAKWEGMECLTVLEKHALVIQQLQEFYEMYKEVPEQRGQRPNERTLAIWIGERRKTKKKGALSTTLEAKILMLPWWSWDPITDAHNKKIEELKSFYEIYNEAPKHSGKRHNEITLATWISHRREDKKKGILDAELEAKIITLPWWSWDPFTDAHTKAIEDLKLFYETYKEVPISRGKRPNEKTLATWMSARRKDKKKGKLDAEIEAQVLTLPWWSWDPFTDAHTIAIEDLKLFYETYKEAPVKRGTRPNEKMLAAWMGSRRYEKKKGTLSTELEAKILTLPWWSWDPISDTHNKAIEDLKSFYETYKEAPMLGGKRPNEKTLYNWICGRRQGKKKGTLDSELEAQVLTLPWWSWDPITDAHNKKIEDLKSFYETYKELPKHSGKRPNEKMLAIWMGSRRYEKKKGTLSTELEAKILTLLWWQWG
jgi:sulfur relay (sulfurtransferase) DsrC/TusE family protein